MQPTVEWGFIAPIVAVLSAGVLGVLIETFVKDIYRSLAHKLVNNAALVLAFIFVVLNAVYLMDNQGSRLVAGELSFDGLAVIFQAILIVVGFISFQAICDKDKSNSSTPFVPNPALGDDVEQDDSLVRTEYYSLVMFSLGAMLIFVSASSLLTMFVALELMSLPLYVLVAIKRFRRKQSKEASLKYFIMGSFASAFFLMGVAFVYGASSSLIIGDVVKAQSQFAHYPYYYVVGVTLIVVGLLFKVAAVPFHAWTPDAYQLAPTPITGFMASMVKIAAVGALMRVAVIFVAPVNGLYSIAIWVVIVLTVLLGTFAGLLQDDIKRLLAYSSIAHAGFIMIGVFAYSAFSVSAVAYYLVAYALATVGIFAVVSCVRKNEYDGRFAEDNSLKAYSGLAKTNPWLAVAMTIFLLSFAGIPLTSGFIGKFMVFTAGIAANMTALVVMSVIASVITAFYYLKVINQMFLHEVSDTTTVECGKGYSKFVIAVCAVLTILLGVMPSILLDVIAPLVNLVP